MYSSLTRPRSTRQLHTIYATLFDSSTVLDRLLAFKFVKSECRNYYQLPLFFKGREKDAEDFHDQAVSMSVLGASLFSQRLLSLLNLCGFDFSLREPSQKARHDIEFNDHLKITHPSISCGLLWWCVGKPISPLRGMADGGKR